MANLTIFIFLDTMKLRYRAQDTAQFFASMTYENKMMWLGALVGVVISLLGIVVLLFVADDASADVDNSSNGNVLNAQFVSNANSLRSEFRLDNNNLTSLKVKIRRQSSPSVTVHFEICEVSDYRYRDGKCSDPLYTRALSTSDVSTIFSDSSSFPLSGELLTESLCLNPENSYIMNFTASSTNYLAGINNSLYQYRAHASNPDYAYTYNFQSLQITTSGEPSPTSNTYNNYPANLAFMAQTENAAECSTESAATSTCDLSEVINLISSSTMPSTSSTTCTIPENTDIAALTACTAVNDEGINYTSVQFPFLLYVFMYSVLAAVIGVSCLLIYFKYKK